MVSNEPFLFGKVSIRKKKERILSLDFLLVCVFDLAIGSKKESCFGEPTKKRERKKGERSGEEKKREILSLFLLL